MRALVLTVAAVIVATLLAFAADRGAGAAPGTLVATAADGAHIAVATAGARNVRVLYVSGGSIVRLHEVFVPEGEAIQRIGWSDDGRNVMVTTRGLILAVDTHTWRVESDAARATSRLRSIVVGLAPAASSISRS